MPPANDDPYGKQYDEAAYAETRGNYEMEQLDKDSVAEIRKMLKGGNYKDPGTLKDHMEYIEKLIQKLTRINQQEKTRGIMNLSFERDFAKIRNLYVEMSALLDKLEGE